MDRPKLLSIGSILRPVRDRVTAGREDPFLSLAHVAPGHLHAVGVGPKPGAQGLRYEAGDILFSRLRPNFRKVLLASAPGLCSPEFWVLRAEPGVDPSWLFYRLSASDTIGWAISGCRGTRMPRADLEAFGAMRIRVPPIEEQRRLVASVAPFDARIRNMRRQAALLQRLLVLRWSGAHRPRRCRFGALLSAVHEPASLSSEGPWVSLADMPRGRLLLEGTAGQRVRQGRHFMQGDLLFARLRPELNKAVVAPSRGVCTTEALVLRGPMPALAAAELCRPDFWARCCAVATGTRMPRVGWSDLSDFPVRAPSDLLATEGRLRPLYDRVGALGGAMERLRLQRDCRVEALLSGH